MGWLPSSTVCLVLLLLSVLNLFGRSFAAQPSKEQVYCSACRLLVDELEYQIAAVDPKKTIEVGSFRVDPKGNQKLSEVPLARSEHHLHELLEKVCEKTKFYGFAVHPETKFPTFVRTEEFDGRKRKFDVNVEKQDLLRSKLMFACDSIIEEHEEALLKALSKERELPAEEFCRKTLKLCTSDEFKSAFPFAIEEAKPTETTTPPAVDTADAAHEEF